MISLSLSRSVSPSLSLSQSCSDKAGDTATREISDLIIVQLAAESWGCGSSGGRHVMYEHKVKPSGKRGEDDV